ncbi:MAG TPA: toxin-antitoxin system HicB family antitoxin [Steroidobacteraceae bacterium]
MAAKKSPKKPTRDKLTLRIDPAFHKRLRVAAAHHNTTIQKLLLTGAEMALGDL